MTLTPTLADDARQTALLRAVGLDRLPPEQRELALNIAQRYDLDLLLKHLVLIEGRAYITRDGLLHIAHRSGQFDGMETTEPTLADGYWRSTCSIWRKDMTRPFTYTGRYPETGKNRAYAPEMSIKVGEVMALRRAFDVSAPAYEERWAGDGEPPEEPAAPTSLADRIAERAAAVSPSESPTDQSPIVSPIRQDDPPAPTPVVKPPKPPKAPKAVPAPVEATPVPVPDPAPSQAATGGMTLEQFATGVAEFSRDALRDLAREMFPDAKSFGSMSDAQRQTLYDAVVVQLSPVVDDVPEDLPAEPMPVEVSETMPASAADDSPCGIPSPWTAGVICDLAAGHAGAHRSGNESW